MKLAFRNLARRKLRTFFALLGVGVSAASLVAITMIAEGTLNQFTELTNRYRGDIVVAQKETADPAWSLLPESMGAELAAMEGVEFCDPLRFTITMHPKLKILLLQGMNPDGPTVRRHPLVDGRAVQKGAPREIMLGADAAKITGLKVGDSIPLKNIPFTVVGIYKTDIRLLDKNCIVELGQMKDLGLDSDNVNLFLLYLKDRKRLQQTIAAVNSRFSKAEAFESNMYLNTFDQVEMLKKFVVAISLLAGTVAMLGILNTMLMSVLERTREIGLLRAVGWSRNSVMLLILQEGLLIGLCGGLIGIVLGVGLERMVTQYADLVGLMAPSYHWSLFVKTVGYSLLMGAVGSIVPAFKAAGMQPVEALRYE